MTDKELDDLFSKTFTGHEMPVPPDIWQRVNPDKEKKRRILFWWWTGLGVAALLLLIGGAVYFSSSSANTNRVTVATSSVEKKITLHTQPAGIQPEPLQPADNPVPDEQKASPAFSPAAKTIKKTGRKDTGNRYDLSSGAKVKKAMTNRSSADSLSSFSGKSSLVFNKTNRVKTEVQETPVYQSESDNQKAANNSTGAIEEKTTAESRKADSVQTAANSKAKAEAKPEASASPVHVKKIHGEKIAGIELAAGAYLDSRYIYGVEKASRSMLVSLGAVDHKSKTSIQSFSVALRIDKPVTKNLSLKTGLQFMQIHQRVTYNQESVSRSVFVNSLSADTTVNAQIHSEDPVVKSVYNNLSVPVLVQYHTNGAKVNIGASAGVLLNLVSWYNGKVPDAEYKQAIAADSIFRRNTGASLYLSFSISKQADSYRFFAEPNVQYTLSPVTKSSAGFRQRMAAYGIGIGIRKQIGK